MNLRYPQITGSTEKEQLAQIKSYLRQLVEQLNNTPSIGSSGGESHSASSSSSSSDIYELRSMIVMELQSLESKFNQLTMTLSEDSGEIAKQAADMISFTLDEDGNLYYEVEE